MPMIFDCCSTFFLFIHDVMETKKNPDVSWLTLHPYHVKYAEISSWYATKLGGFVA